MGGAYLAVGLARHFPPMTNLHFPLGLLAITPGAEAALPHDFIVDCFRRHARADFGELDEHDVAVNRSAIVFGTRILSQYTHAGIKVFVITDGDRGRTTLLLADEY